LPWRRNLHLIANPQPIKIKMNTNEQKKAQHTPGDWAPYNASHGRIFKQWRVRDHRGCCIAKIEQMPGQSSEEEHANAHLIAAAPDLLEALQGFFKEFPWTAEVQKRHPNSPAGKVLSKARAAIAKATGEGKQ
jgi:hypothetical protein